MALKCLQYTGFVFLVISYIVKYFTYYNRDQLECLAVRAVIYKIIEKHIIIVYTVYFLHWVCLGLAGNIGSHDII